MKKEIREILDASYNSEDCINAILKLFENKLYNLHVPNKYGLLASDFGNSIIFQHGVEETVQTLLKIYMKEK